MSFRDNLQHLRATHAMTQEQLALMLGVSRQSVTKWEAEKSYPEMDKLLKLCQIFDVTLDDLVQGDLTTSAPTPAVQARAAILREAAGGPPQDVCGYDEHMRTFAWKIAWGVFAILAGVALLMAWGGWAEASAPSLEAVGLIPLFAGIAIGLAFILTGAFQHTEFQRSHPFIQDFYTVEDRQRAQRLFAWLLVAGIVLIFTGIVALALTEGASEFVQEEMAALMMGLVAAGVWCIVYGSMMLGRLNIANYNDAREQTIAESDEGKLIVNSDAAALRAMYTDEQICSLLGVPEATDDEIDRARARIERKRRKDQARPRIPPSVAARSFTLIGLERWSSAPARFDSCTSSVKALAESTTTGNARKSSRALSRMRRVASRPFMTGI